MVADGLEDEAKSLFELRNLNALNSVGYKEFFEYFEGKITRDKAIDFIKRDTRRFAKRQMTWWAREKDIRWFEADEKDLIIDFITSILNLK